MFHMVWRFSGIIQDYECIGIFSSRNEAEQLAQFHEDVPARGRPLPIITAKSHQDLVERLIQVRFRDMADSIARIEAAVCEQVDVLTKPKGAELYGEGPVAIDVCERATE